MAWGDLEQDARPEKRQRSAGAEAAACSWEALLQSRQACREESEPKALWGELPADAAERSGRVPVPRFCLELHLPSKKVLEVADGHVLLLKAPGLLSWLEDEGSNALVRKAHLPLPTLGLHALQVVVEFVLKGTAEALWHAGTPRAISRAAVAGEVQQVEQALHTFEVWETANCLGIHRLEAEAEARLLGDAGAPAHLNEASAMPLFAASFSRNRKVSAGCLSLLTSRAAQILPGRERQLGVLFATAPVVGSLLASIFRAHLSCTQDKSLRPCAAEPLLLDLLLGPTRTQHLEKSSLCDHSRRSAAADFGLPAQELAVALAQALDIKPS